MKNARLTTNDKPSAQNSADSILGRLPLAIATSCGLYIVNLCLYLLGWI